MGIKTFAATTILALGVSYTIEVLKHSDHEFPEYMEWGERLQLEFYGGPYGSLVEIKTSISGTSAISGASVWDAR